MVHCGGGGRHSCSGDADGGGRSSDGEQQPDRKSGEENGSPGVPFHKSSESESKVGQRIHLFSPFFLSYSLFSGSSSVDDVKRNKKD